MVSVYWDEFTKAGNKRSVSKSDVRETVEAAIEFANSLARSTRPHNENITVIADGEVVYTNNAYGTAE